MQIANQDTFEELLLALGDDELVLGHRASEWCGHAPILEEDIAFANIALDEIGHAAIWYSVLAEVAGEDPETYPDHLAYRRPAGEFRNIQLVELPRGDWAFSMLRQFLFDQAETVRLEALQGSQVEPLAAAAAKIRTEEIYHSRHTRAWVLRLGQGTEESHTRLQAALNELWPYTGQLFLPLPEEDRLVAARVIPPAEGLRAAWQALVLPCLEECALELPDRPLLEAGRGEHTPHLAVLLAEMQSTARLDPDARW